MNPIVQTDAEIIAPHRYIADRAPLIITTRGDDRVWATKTGEWPQGCYGPFLIRLGVELIYYALARHNNLPMPESRVLRIRGQLPMWGTEIIDVRTALGENDDDLSAGCQTKLAETFQKDAKEIAAYLKAVFLDVMLLNDDRTVSNVLHTLAGGLVALSYFDHEQSLGWKNDIDVFGKNRIKSQDEEYRELDTHLWLERKYHWGARHSKMAQRKEIFDSIKLESALLDELRELAVDKLNWISPFQFTPMKTGLATWWAYLRALPYEELDARMFPPAA